jgi:CheY-like chemotaxis protein
LPLSLSNRTPTRIADEEKSAEFTSRFDPVRLDGVRVLLVDDDPDARGMLVRVLGECGADTRDTANVKDALSALEDFQPHIVLSDLGMPGHDGFELIRKIRSAGYTVSRLPAIALTGFARPQDRHRALLAGFQVHVSKPINPNELTAVIASLVGRTGGM